MYGSSPRMYACFCIRIKLCIFLTTQTFRRSLDINDKCPLSGTYVLRSILFLKVGGMDSSKKSLQAKRGWGVVFLLLQFHGSFSCFFFNFSHGPEKLRWGGDSFIFFHFFTCKFICLLRQKVCVWGGGGRERGWGEKFR